MRISVNSMQRLVIGLLCCSLIGIAVPSHAQKQLTRKTSFLEASNFKRVTCFIQDANAQSMYAFTAAMYGDRFDQSMHSEPFRKKCKSCHREEAALRKKVSRDGQTSCVYIGNKHKPYIAACGVPFPSVWLSTASKVLQFEHIQPSSIDLNERKLVINRLKRSFELHDTFQTTSQAITQFYEKTDVSGKFFEKFTTATEQIDVTFNLRSLSAFSYRATPDAIRIWRQELQKEHETDIKRVRTLSKRAKAALKIFHENDDKFPSASQYTGVMCVPITK